MKKENKISRESIKTAVNAWAEENKAKVTEQDDEVQGYSLFIKKDGWRIEVRPEDGWAYLHGRGTVPGVSTNIQTLDELSEGIDRLLAKVEEGDN